MNNERIELNVNLALQFLDRGLQPPEARTPLTRQDYANIEASYTFVVNALVVGEATAGELKTVKEENAELRGALEALEKKVTDLLAAGGVKASTAPEEVSPAEPGPPSDTAPRGGRGQAKQGDSPK